MNKKRYFLDYAAATPLDPRVASEMRKAERSFWANPASLHQEGEEAKKVLEESRIKIARLLHCKAGEIFFTSSGTESLNLAILGTVAAAREKQGPTFRPHIITSAIEHSAVLEPIKFLVQSGQAEASFVLPGPDGTVSPQSVDRELIDNTVLVAVAHANSEIGTIQPVREISKTLGGTRGGAVLLVDASQSVLYEDVSLERLGADLLVLDGLKIYGPRGAGILAMKKNVKISPVIFGGGQEKGLRPGTPNVPAAAGLSKALEIAADTRERESKRLKTLRDYAVVKILKEIPNSSLNGSLEKRLPSNINVCLPGQDSEFLVIKLDTLGFAVSAASACQTIDLENSSYVIEAVSGGECASSSLRITLGRYTKKSDLDALISNLKKIIH